MFDENTLKSSMWEGAQDAFETMIMMPIAEADDFQVDDDGTNSMTGSITFTGSLEGALSFQSDIKSAAAVSKSMLMMEPDEEIDESEIKDAIGEVANLVIGGFKSRIADSVGDIDISVPTVITGANVRPALGLNSKKLEICATGQDSQIKFILAYKG